jgi:hypothetical protein
MLQGFHHCGSFWPMEIGVRGRLGGYLITYSTRFARSRLISVALTLTFCRYSALCFRF